MVPLISVRNLSPTPFSITCIETFLDLNSRQSKSSRYLAILNDDTAAFPTSPVLAEHSQNGTRREVMLTLKPFESYTLEQPREGKTRDGLVALTATLRLTLETSSGERYRIDTNPSYTQKSTRALTALTPSPLASYRALFHPSRPIPHLTIHSNHRIRYDRWMTDIPDTMPLSALSIPGTHNSHTHYRALPSVRCQCVDIKTQLDNGIRFLDIRLQPVHATDTTKKELYLVHGAFPVCLTGPKYFEPVLNTCYDFLAAHPSETILLSLKREGIGSATDEHLARILDQHYIRPHSSRWYTAPWIPYLGAVRGKLILLRRYHTASIPASSPSPSCQSLPTPTPPPTTATPTGIDATAWPHNATHALFPSEAPPFNTQLCLQDACEMPHPTLLASKIAHCTAHLARAASLSHPIPSTTTDPRHPVPPAPLHLNFLSASNFWNKHCWPASVARVVNPRAEEWICRAHHLGEGEEEEEVVEREKEERGKEEQDKAVRSRGSEGGRRRGRNVGDGGTGIVVMDYVGEGNGGWDLVGLIVGCNMGVLGKVGGQDSSWW